MTGIDRHGDGGRVSAEGAGSPTLELERRADRLLRGLEFLQLLGRTFVSLQLVDRQAIADTLLSLVMTHLEAEQGAVLLVDPDAGALAPVSLRGFADETAWLAAGDQPLFARALEGRLARWVEPASLGAEWPAAPAELARGAALVGVDLRERPVAVLLLANRLSEEPLHPEELGFLDTAAALASLILANAEIQAAQKALLAEVELQASEARREAAEKAAALREIAESQGIIEEQRLAIRELSTPILPVWDGVLVLPILGLIDTRRAADLMDRLLAAVATQGARYAILDVTGVEIVDTRTADYLVKVVRAAELLGAECLLCGVRPAVAQTLVELGIDLSGLNIGMDLQAGLKECLRRMRRA